MEDIFLINRKILNHSFTIEFMFFRIHNKDSWRFNKDVMWYYINIEGQLSMTSKIEVPRDVRNSKGP